eukprot:642947-Pyramimonas_sp.AAC.1
MRCPKAWSKVRGPLEVIWMTLERIGWRLVSSTLWHDDENYAIDALLFPPKYACELVQRGGK